MEHDHDNRYYTESELNNKLSAKANLQSPNLTGNPTVNGISVATIKSPTWYELTPSSNYTATSGPYYCKDGCGIVWLMGVLRRGSVPLGGEVILTLPVGFRPSRMQPLMITATNGVDGPWTTFAYVHTNGNMALSTGSIPSNWISNAHFAFQTSFPVA